MCFVVWTLLFFMINTFYRAESFYTYVERETLVSYSKYFSSNLPFLIALTNWVSEWHILTVVNGNIKSSYDWLTRGLVSKLDNPHEQETDITLRESASQK